MYDELVSRLRSSCESCKLWDGHNCCLKGDCTAQTRLQAADAIEELSKPRWIPVTERLPDKCIPVLVCFDFKGRKSVDVADLWSDGGFHNYSDEYLTPEGRKYRKGTHWMPLPEPPKEETE